MKQLSIEKLICRILSVGTPLITIFVFAGPLADPVNVTKLLLLGIFGTALLFLLIPFYSSLFSRSRILFTISILAFISLSFLTLFTSQAPLNLNFYGLYGRNTGFLTYFLFAIFALAGTCLKSTEHFKKLIYGFFGAGVINILYCLWAWQIDDFIPWNNIYGSILGTFGNPNFIGAFLGMVIVALAAYGLQSGLKFGPRLVIITLSLIAFLEVIASNAIQGLVVTFGGLSIILFYWIKINIQSKVLLLLYSGLVLSLGVISSLGALQIGPLSSIIYKRSVSLRGSYWKAGIEMGRENLFTGVGMDAYGNNYRRYRDENAFLSMPGPETVSNAAHNIFIDIFAFGGMPLLISYLLMVGLTALSIFKVGRRAMTFDPVFAAMAGVWICYQVQSFISINQIGLAVWGWVLSGALIAYAEVFQNNLSPHKKQKTKNTGSLEIVELQSGLLALAGMVVGAVISIPPLTADATWLSALKTQNLTRIRAALEPSYFNPSDSARLVSAVTILDRSQLYSEALSMARYGVTYNADFTDAWKSLLYTPEATEFDKKSAKENLIRLDPLNPAWKELK